MVSICKIFKFEAAHCLVRHSGKCKNLHGHSYKLEVEISGEIHKDGLADHGMIVDFGVLKTIISPLLETIDHQNLNDIYLYPTAELMVDSISESLQRLLSQGAGRICLERVRLWETDTSYAEWRKDET